VVEQELDERVTRGLAHDVIVIEHERDLGLHRGEIVYQRAHPSGRARARDLEHRLSRLTDCSSGAAQRADQVPREQRGIVLRRRE
jgi:hypothetical protein